MLSRAMDQIILAAGGLPAHIAVAQRFYRHDPLSAEALRRLSEALAELDQTLLAPAAGKQRAAEP